jgi:hypothetical protein
MIIKSHIMLRTRACHKLFGPVLKVPHAGFIYSLLFKYTQQYTAGFTENKWALHLLKPALLRTIQATFLL